MHSDPCCSQTSLGGKGMQMWLCFALMVTITITMASFGLRLVLWVVEFHNNPQGIGHKWDTLSNQCECDFALLYGDVGSPEIKGKVPKGEVRLDRRVLTWGCPCEEKHHQHKESWATSKSPIVGMYWKSRTQRKRGGKTVRGAQGTESHK